VYPVTHCVTYRVRLSRQCKARPAVNGGTLYKGRNAAMSVQARSRRASRKAFICGVLSLENGTTIPCEKGLAAKSFPTRYKLHNE
jgi:hypothetical protein